jgi:hypothetical protein
MATPGSVQLQLDVFAAPMTAVSAAIAIYTAAKKNRRNVDWKLVQFSPVLGSVTPQCKSAAIIAVAERCNTWWNGQWWCGSQLGPFWDKLAIDQDYSQSSLGKALLAIALELSSVMSATEAAEVVLNLLQSPDTMDSTAIVKTGGGSRNLMIGDVMPALHELGQQGSIIYMREERVKFEKIILRQIGGTVSIASMALMGRYMTTDVDVALQAIEDLLKGPDGSVSEISCQAGAIKLGFLISNLFGVTLTIFCDEAPDSGTVPGTIHKNHTLRIRASKGPSQQPRLFTPYGNLLSTAPTFYWNHSVHSEACVEHISVILCRWQHHWAIPDAEMMVFSRCLLSNLVSWRRESAFTGNLYHQWESSTHLGATYSDNSGFGKAINGFQIKSVVSRNGIIDVYKMCLREYTIPDDEEIERLVTQEEDLVERWKINKTYEDQHVNTMPMKNCRCPKHLPKAQIKPSGLPLGCLATDGHSLFNFLSAALRVLTLVDIEDPTILSANHSPTTAAAAFDPNTCKQLGYIYHGTAVRKSVGNLPPGRDKTKVLTFAQIFHAATWLFAGPAGGSAADNQGVVGVCVNDVALVGNFCLRPKLFGSDSRIHVSYGRTFFQGSHIQRLVSYDQVGTGILPLDRCLGKPQPAKGVQPSLFGINSNSVEIKEVVNLRDDVATLAYRIRWLEQSNNEPRQRDILGSPSTYLLGLGWHMTVPPSCSHNTDSQIPSEGTIRVISAGFFPQEPDRDRTGKILWPAEYNPSPPLPSPGGFTGCLALTKDCLPVQVAIVCSSGAGKTVVLQRGCCVVCACEKAAEVGAVMVVCA